MGHPGEQANLLFVRDGEEVLGRILFQDAVNDLATADVALLHAGLAFFEPADVRSQSRAVVADLALVFQFLEGLEHLVLFDGVNARVVQLVEVDVVRLQSAQRLLAGEADELRLELLRPLLVADARRGLIVDVIAGTWWR